MEKWIYRILCLLTLLVFAAIFLQEKFRFVDIKELSGAVEKTEKPNFSFASYRSGEYQSALERYSKENFGFREIFIRCYNQYLWKFYKETNSPDVMAGKEGWLYEPRYVREYYEGLMYNCTEDAGVIRLKLMKEARRIFFLQEILKQYGVTLFVMIEPGKERIYPEYLPDNTRYTRGKQFSAVDFYPLQFDSLGVNYLNICSWFENQKGKTDYPLFPQTATHWSNIAALHVTDTLIRYMESVGGHNIRNMSIGDSYFCETFEPDNDLEKLLNLQFSILDIPNKYADFSIEEDGSAEKPSLLTIGDSFFWNISYHINLDEIFSSHHFWYYNSTIYYDDRYNSTSEVDLLNELLSSDYIMLSYCTAQLYDMPNMFASKALVALCFDDEQISAKIEGIINSIYASEEWLASIKQKADEQGRPLEDVLRDDACYLLYMEPEQYFDELRGSDVPKSRNRRIEEIVIRK
ncbi:MAG: hypothetical protein IKO34_11450 [Bacteroidales bacterium]|nr:hypothetical protein [Bacteroidales bacterium]